MSPYPKDLNLAFALRPGDHLVGCLKEQNVTQQEFTKLSGVSGKYINELISGRAQMTAEAAISFEKVLGISADFWMRFEMLYQLKLAYDAEYQAKKKKSKRSNLISGNMVQNEAFGAT